MSSSSSNADRKTRKCSTETESVRSSSCRFDSIDDCPSTAIVVDPVGRPAVRKKSASTHRKYLANENEDDETLEILEWPEGGRRSSNDSTGPSVRAVVDEDDTPLDPRLVRDCADLKRRLEMMHDRCIARNLRAAGLGGYENENDDAVYGCVLDPNARMSTGETMLTAAVLSIEDPDCQARYASILLGEGADVNASDGEGKTVLMHVCAGGYERVAKLLFQYDKTDLLQRDEDGNTALMYAAAVGASKILKHYLKALRKYERSYKSQRSFDEQHSPPSLAPVVMIVEQQPSSASSNVVAPPPPTASNDDPLDMRNLLGDTARTLATKNGHSECVNLLNEERCRRMKDVQKRLGSISYQRGASPPALLRGGAGGKKGSQKYFVSHSSSFDSVYFEAATGGGIGVDLDDRGQYRPSITPLDESRTDAGVEKSGKPRRSTKKRFQSNPDLYRQKLSGASLEAASSLVDDEQDSEAMVDPLAIRFKSRDDDREFDIARQRRQTVQGHWDAGGPAIMLTTSGRRGESSPDRGGVHARRKYSAHVSTIRTHQHHQPVIGCPSLGATVTTTANVRESTTVVKKNLTEKLMNFLRRRPKEASTVGQSDSDDRRDRRPAPQSIVRSTTTKPRRIPPPPAAAQNRSNSSGGFDAVVGGGGRDASSEISGGCEYDSAVGGGSSVETDHDLVVNQRRSVETNLASGIRSQSVAQQLSSDPLAVGIGPRAGSAGSSSNARQSQPPPSVLPRLAPGVGKQQGGASQKLIPARKSQESFWNTHDEDSGLASSGASGGGSRPVSADSNRSHRVAAASGSTKK